MKNLLLCGLALSIAVLLTGPVDAQGKKMTRDEYNAQIADLVQREAEAQRQIASLQSRIAELDAHSIQMDLMGLPQSPQAKINIHVGGAYGEHDKALARFCDGFKRLSANSVILKNH